MTQPQELSTMSLLPILSETPVTLNSFPRRLGNLSIRVGPPSQMIGWKKKEKKRNRFEFFTILESSQNKKDMKKSLKQHCLP